MLLRLLIYENAGTIEFLLDEKNRSVLFHGNEYPCSGWHAVTEFVSGVDIVKDKIRIAAGEKLSVTQDDIEIKGHAVSVMSIRENPKFNFSQEN